MGRCPLIEVQGLTKCYDGRAVVADLTFSAPRGQVVGLLGPRGAGKSTTMRILAGCLDATSGTVGVAGWDVFDRSREARRRIGYLPESAPLYDEMRVQPYLHTMCRLRGVAPAVRRAGVERALDACGLGDRRREVSGRLPAALRRRVGLAQAVVHEPDVLLLDEPAAGLAPGQARETWELIGRLARGRTVVLASHVISEVNATCDRVLIIRQGRLVVDDTPANLTRRHGRRSREVVAVVGGDADEVERRARALAGVAEVALTDLGGGDHRLTVTGDRDDLQDAVARVVVEHGFRLKELSSREAGPDDVFRDLTMEEAS
jgi:ABC-2 type transport system ATP-binding protein